MPQMAQKDHLHAQMALHTVHILRDHIHAQMAQHTRQYSGYILRDHFHAQMAQHTVHMHAEKSTPCPNGSSRSTHAEKSPPCPK